jgi:uncharacterized membrane protein YoaK (UPF0700 family)
VNVPLALATHDVVIALAEMVESSGSRRLAVLRLATLALVLLTLLTVAVSVLAATIPGTVTDSAELVPTVVWSGVLVRLARPLAPMPKASGLVVGWASAAGARAMVHAPASAVRVSPLLSEFRMCHPSLLPAVRDG